jgi:hypothetical protein
MKGVTIKRHVTAKHRLARTVQTLQADVHSSPARGRLNWTPFRTHLNGLVRLAERRKLVFAYVPLHVKHILPQITQDLMWFPWQFWQPGCDSVTHLLGSSPTALGARRNVFGMKPSCHPSSLLQ